MELFDVPFTIANRSEYMKVDLDNIDLSNVRHVKIANPYWVPRNLDTLISPNMAERLGLKLWPYLPPVTLHDNMHRFVSSKDNYKSCDYIALLDTNTGLLIDGCHPVLVPDLPVDIVLGTFQFYYFNREVQAGRLVVSRETITITRGPRNTEKDGPAYKNLL